MTEAEWLGRGDPILRLEADRGWPSPRKQRLFAVACCRRVLHLLPADPVWRQGLAVAEGCADRRAKRAELQAAHDAIGRAVTVRVSRTYRDALARLATAAVAWACHPTQRAYAGQAAVAAACAAAYAALPLDEAYVPPAESAHRRRWAEAEKAEQAAQVALLCDVCGHPFRPPVGRAGRPGAETVRVARAAYEDRPEASGALDAARLAVLADALEESGGADEAVVAHLSSAGPHVRGCWAVDLVLDMG